jgi:hypothetical protein
MLKKKKLPTEQPSVLAESVEKKRKEAKKPAEGSRLTAIWLLLITIILGGLFYGWGLMEGKGIEFKLLKTSNTWEYHN